MKNILCYGDSNTHGYCSVTGGRYGVTERWPRILGAELGESYCVIEEGLSGRTTCFDDPLYEGLNGYRMIFPVLMTHEPIDLLIIMLGTNDVKARFNATPDNTAKGLERLVNKAISTSIAFTNCKPKILIIAPPPIDKRYAEHEVYGEMGPDCDIKTRVLANLFEQVAKRTGCLFLDAGSIDGVSMEAVDWMHLSAKGHQRLAQRIAEFIKENDV